MTQRVDHETSNSLNIEAATPKVIKIIVGERTVLEGVLNTGSVLTVQTREGRRATVHRTSDRGPGTVKIAIVDRINP